MVLFRKPEEHSELDGWDWSAVSLCATDCQDSSPGLFEFSTAAASEMCAAGDVILGGKLLPFGAQPPPRPKKGQAHELDRRRSMPLGDRSRCFALGGEVAAEHRQLRPGASDSGQGTRKPRPRWYVLAFGSGRVPAEMELREIRIRQRRRGATPPTPPNLGHRLFPHNRWCPEPHSSEGMERVGPMEAPAVAELQGDGGGGCCRLKWPFVG